MASLMPVPSSPDFPLPLTKPRLLLVSDSAERLHRLRAWLNSDELELRSVSSLAELQRECASEHALAAIDVSPAQLPQVLAMIRASHGHYEIPVLVETSRNNALPAAAGLLPKYRAMPCSLRQMAALAHPHNEQRAPITKRIL